MAAVCLLIAMMMSPAAQAAKRVDATASAWSMHKNTVTCTMPGGQRQYQVYNQRNGGLYMRSQGCITTAVAICASGFGIHIHPKKIRSAGKDNPLGEKYALAMMGKKPKCKFAPMSLRLASQILTDMGIENRRVTSFQTETAVEEIRAHLLAGKPVLVKVRNKKWKGVMFTGNQHALVLIGIVGDNVIFANPAGGTVNKSSVGEVNDKINIPISVFVDKFMYSSRKHTEKPYTKKRKDAGGYILVG